MAPDGNPDRERGDDDAFEGEDGSHGPSTSRRGERGLGRRHLLQTLSAASTGGLAGCNTIEGLLGGDDTPTEYGYGGTPTDVPGEGTPTGTATSTSTSTDTKTSTATRTATATATSTSSPADDYGEQGYGQYGYGGTR